jgi:hypothetical protein
MKNFEFYFLMFFGSCPTCPEIKNSWGNITIFLQLQIEFFSFLLKGIKVPVYPLNSLHTVIFFPFILPAGFVAEHRGQ